MQNSYVKQSKTLLRKSRFPRQKTQQLTSSSGSATYSHSLEPGSGSGGPSGSFGASGSGSLTRKQRGSRNISLKKAQEAAIFDNLE